MELWVHESFMKTIYERRRLVFQPACTRVMPNMYPMKLQLSLSMLQIQFCSLIQLVSTVYCTSYLCVWTNYVCNQNEESEWIHWMTRKMTDFKVVKLLFRWKVEILKPTINPIREGNKNKTLIILHCILSCNRQLILSGVLNILTYSTFCNVVIALKFKTSTNDLHKRFVLVCI